MTFSTMLIGNSTLLIRCAEQLLSNGHSIAGVATRNAQIKAWCAGHAIRCENQDETPADKLLAEADFDILFSIANLDMLPASLIARARRISLNFHDGPLPGMAGLNVPVWALLAGATQHAVTWHEMTTKADAGRLAVVEPFEIAADDTAFSLNAKCYEAGLASFQRLVTLLEQGELPLTAQSGERCYFAKARRPELGGLIDPSRPAEDIARLVRALDHGRYWNPLALAKVMVAGGALAVGSADVLVGAAPTATPGTILAREADAIVIATGRGAVRLGGLASLDGTPVSAAALLTLAPGLVVSRPPAASLPKIEMLVEAAARAEPFWLKTLGVVAAGLELPYPRLAKPAEWRSTAGSWHRNPVAADLPAAAAALGAADEAVLLSALAIWLQRLDLGPRVLVSIETPATSATVDGATGLFRADRPLLLTSSGAETPASIVRRTAEAIATAERTGPVARDLASRLARAEAPLAGLPQPLIAFVAGTGGSGAADHGASIVLHLDTATRAVELAVDAASYGPATAATMASHLAHVLAWLRGHCEAPVESLPLVPEAERQLFSAINDATATPVAARHIDVAIAAQAAATPDRIALRWHSLALTYRELSDRIDALASHLTARGAGRGSLVAVALERTPAMVVTLVAILRAGAAYVPVDPRFPKDRIQLIREDSGARLLVTDKTSEAGDGVIVVDRSGTPRGVAVAAGDGGFSPPSDRALSDLAYVTFTSGSTGRPKGVRLTHANVANFFAGMDERVPHRDGGTWLAVTSISFDISVLELLWTLARGYTIALHSEVPEVEPEAALAFSLFYFAASGAPGGEMRAGGSADTYRLLMEGARFADAHGFEAVWTPERHFHGFGGIYPNPAVTGAAIAAVTRNVAIRAGSCVLPLHDPLRVAEDWSLIDNISGGRAGVAFAAGWMPEDFVLATHAFADRKALMLEHIATIERLWRGERIERDKPNGGKALIGTLPRPVQTALPVWLTAARNPETFEIAGRRGWNVLTHLLGMSVEELAGNVALYRKARREAGHPGEGRVTLMLHTFVGSDEELVRETVREPMKRYLASAVDIVKAAEWSFPTLIHKDEQAKKAGAAALSASDLSAEDLDAVLEHAFDRYYRTSGLFGAPERCVEMARRLKRLGIDELACLIDFGVETDSVLASLPLLADVLLAANAGAEAPRASVASDIVRHGATHFQCTPSMAAMLLADEDGRAALSGLEAMLVGGEALPPDMARKLVGTVRGKVLNMYGPTETTVWSTSAELDGMAPFVPLGRPIANTQLEIVDTSGRPLPALVAGELLIGGDGVADGYWHRAELTAERFVMRETGSGPRRYYRTGDLVRRHPCGALEFLGRIDHQVKIRGHRIELGEIEATLATATGVAAAVVVARETGSGPELAAFVTAMPGTSPDPRALRTHIETRLPAIMVPAAIVVLERLPLTANGKVDRKALATRPAAPASTEAGRGAAVGAQSRTPPKQAAPMPATASPSGGSSSIEPQLAGLWCRLLGLDEVGPTQNFFDLGGHSLLAVELHRAISSELGLEPKLTDIFRFPTVSGLARHLAQLKVPVTAAAASAPATAAEGSDRARMRLAMSRRGRTGQPVATTDTAKH
ncbi:MAG: LLM class flavin-dependent oxidoreductase [Hyphomicrobiaceae bacterium]|nr:LLM class flavin-dependent oxidoreductase [Hyphomicrobiaceae bacterium]